MRRITIPFLLLAGLGLLACASTRPPEPNVPAAIAEERSASRADHQELAALAAEDQAVRRGAADPRSDDERRARVLELLAGGEVRTPRDKLHAGIVLQHTGLTFCGDSLRSLSAENYLLAHHLFTAALGGGVEEARYLVAASIDRYLGFTVGRQRYGTNRVIDQETGREELVPIDRSVSDEERRRYGVPSLAELLATFPEQDPVTSD